MSHTKLDGLSIVAAGAERTAVPASRSSFQQPAFGDHLSRASAAGTQRAQNAPAPRHQQDQQEPSASQPGTETANAPLPTPQAPEAEVEKDAANPEKPEKKVSHEAQSQDERAPGEQAAEQIAVPSPPIELLPVDHPQATDGAEHVEPSDGQTIISDDSIVAPAEPIVPDVKAEQPRHSAISPNEMKAAASDKEISVPILAKIPSTAPAPTSIADTAATAVEPVDQLAIVPQESATTDEPTADIRTITSSPSEEKREPTGSALAPRQQETMIRSDAPQAAEPHRSGSAVQPSDVQEGALRRGEPSPGRPRSSKVSATNSSRRGENEPAPSRTGSSEPGSVNNHSPSSVIQTISPAANVAAIVSETDRADTQDLAKPSKAEAIAATGTRSQAGHETARSVRRGSPEDDSPRLDAARFVGRVARAFQTAQERGGALQLRLSPPELGSLRLELHVQEGVMTATLETENAAARRVLLEHLPMLRDRLAEQNIRIERFDVDVRREDGGGPTNDRAAQQQQHRQEPNHTGPRRESIAHAAGEKAASQAPPTIQTSSHAHGIDLLV